MRKIHRGQIELYALGPDYSRKLRENFWKKPLRNIRKDNLSDFELRIQEKFPKAFHQLKKLAKEPFNGTVNRKANDAYFQDIFRQIKQQTGVYRFESFLYAHEGGKGLYDAYTPFRQDEAGVFHLSKPYQQFFFPHFRRINTLAVNVGCRINWVLIPGKYGNNPFKNNHQGVHDMFDPAARPYIQKMEERAGNILDEVYGSKVYLLRGSNEVAHQGSREKGILIKAQHEFMYEFVRPNIPVSSWVSDVTFSDYVQLTEREWFCVIKNLETGREFEDILTKKEYDLAKQGQLVIGGVKHEWVRTQRILGKDEYDRLNWLKQNGFNPWKFDEPVEDGSATWMDTLRGAGSKKFTLSTDGNTKGSGEEYCGGTWFNLTYEEGVEFVKKCDELQSYGKAVIASDLPKECFFINKRNWIEEDWSLLNIERLKFFQEKQS